MAAPAARSGVGQPERAARPTVLPVSLDVNGLFLGAVVGAALLATGAGALGYERIQHALLIVLTGVVAGRALILTSVKQLSMVGAMLTVSLAFLLLISVVVSERVTGNHLYLAFVVAMVISLQLGRPVKPAVLLRVTNLYYLVYLALSLAVYAGLIDLGRSLNAFDATLRVPGLNFTTLVGFYGSTAHIDSISLFVALVNVLFGRGRGRQLMVGIAVAACLASVRFTPFVSLGLAVLASWVVERVKRAGAVRDTVAVAVGLAFVLSTPLTLGVSAVVSSPGLDRAINRATTGRLLIWQEMDLVFAEMPPLNRAFGTGTTEPYYEVGGWPRIHPVTRIVDEFWTANAHNSYFAVALTLGVFTFVLLAGASAFFVARLETRRARLISFYVLAVGITNAELFTFYFPIYLIWLAWMFRS